MAHSMIVNYALRPVKNAVGEAVGEIVADIVGATGHSRQRIVNNTRRVVSIGSSLAISVAMADAVGAADVIDGMTS